VILIDSNIIIDAHDRVSPFRSSSAGLIADAVEREGAGINAIVLAELCVGQEHPHALEGELRSEGLLVFDFPVAAAPICGAAFARYRSARKRSGGGVAPTIPLPDFFIGAHAELMGWPIATRDTERYRLYFPNVRLLAA
jgi:predicted nucleic acid-binding protein